MSASLSAYPKAFLVTRTRSSHANNLVQMNRGTDEPFDGILEFFFPNAGGLMKQPDSPRSIKSLAY